MVGKSTLSEAIVCIVGLGYVGLPLAQAFAKSLKVIGFDVDGARVKKLREASTNRNPSFTSQPKEIGKADFVIICVPTPVTSSRKPDLSYVRDAARTVGRNLKKGSVVVLESTVYPGVTEEVVKPILENESGLSCGEGFKVAYSPERINPGDGQHSVDKVTKVVAGMDEEVAELVAELYRQVAPRVFKARDIRTAEASKLVENIQRDLNIAVVNELALIFERLGLNTRDVLEAAATKWNFHRYSPGLVGGPCIPVVPHFLVYKSRESGFLPQLIRAGRKVNDSMPRHVVSMTIEALKSAGKAVRGSRVLIMGLTYKPDVADTRDSPVKDIVLGLQEQGVKVTAFDPLLEADGPEKEFNIELCRDLEEVKQAKWDSVVFTVAHAPFRKLSLSDLKAMQHGPAILIDVPGIFNADEARQAGFHYRTL